MSLLDRGPHTVTVIPKVKVVNGYNSYDWVDGTPVTVSNIAVQPTQPVSEQVSTGLGDQVRSNLRVIGRGVWPGGPHSTVIFEGREYDQGGEASQYSMSPRTAHFSLVIQARSSEVY